MTKNVFVFDLTRHRGPVQSLISSARAYAQTSQGTVEWLFSPLQRVDGILLDGAVHRAFEYDVWPMLEKRLHEFTNGAGDLVVHIFSHSGYVLSKAESFQTPSLTIQATSFKFLPRSLGGFQTPTTGTLSVEEAIELTKKVLDEGGHVSEQKSLLECYLRPQLFKQDRRAAKRSHDLTSLTLIRQIVDRGLNEGWLKRTRIFGRSGTERIWLVQQSPSVVAVNPQPTAIAVEASPAPSILAPSVDAAAPPQPATPASPGKTLGTNTGKARTQEMIAALNKAFVYSPCNIRRYVFSAIELIKKEGTVKNQTVAQFMKEVKERTMAEAENQGVSYKHWRATMDAILEMLLSAKVLIGPGEEPITRGLHARGTQLISIAANFEDACELCLLKVLIKKMHLNSKDRVAIAHALFKEGSQKEYEQLEDRLDALFTLMGSELVESADGSLLLGPEVNAVSSPAPRVN